MTTDTDTFTFDRTFPLPPAKMWHLMTDAKMRETWGAPGDAVLEMLSVDFRIGGIERHRGGPAEAPDFEVETRWYHITAPSDAVYTEVIEAGGMRLGASLVTYRIADHADGAAVSITVAVTSFVGPEMIAEFQSGWEGGIVNLEAAAVQHADTQQQLPER